MSDLGVECPIQQDVRLGGVFLTALNAHNVPCHHKAEQDHGSQGRRYADPNHLVNALTHSSYPSLFPL